MQRSHGARRPGPSDGGNNGPDQQAPQRGCAASGARIPHLWDRGPIHGRPARISRFRCFAFDCDLFKIESEIAKVNWRTPWKRLLDRTFDSLHWGRRHGCGCGMRRAGKLVFPCEMNDLASERRPGDKLVHAACAIWNITSFGWSRGAIRARNPWQSAAYHPAASFVLRTIRLRPAGLGLGLFLLRPYRRPNLLPRRVRSICPDEVVNP